MQEDEDDDEPLPNGSIKAEDDVKLENEEDEVMVVNERDHQ